MMTTVCNHLKGRFSDAEARVLCYVLGPLSGLFFLQFRHYCDVWSIRFHAFHSMSMAGAWGAAWGTFRLIEAISPWFVATLARELRFAMDLGFIVVWAFLLATAYGGGRCAVIPPVHSLAVRLARKSGHPAHRHAESG